MSTKDKPCSTCTRATPERRPRCTVHHTYCYLLNKEQDCDRHTTEEATKVEYK